MTAKKHSWIVLKGGKPAEQPPEKVEALPRPEEAPPERRHGQMGYSGPERRSSGQILPAPTNTGIRRAS